MSLTNSIAALEYADREIICARIGHSWRVLEGEERICVRCKVVRRIEIVR
ncbi:MAG: hypothetical protein JRN16_07250 [Nitrososphaerota archaeon]|nr:hypothetical protein [Nitrososphaerota archaeon]